VVTSIEGDGMGGEVGWCLAGCVCGFIWVEVVMRCFVGAWLWWFSNVWLDVSVDCLDDTS